MDIPVRTVYNIFLNGKEVDFMDFEPKSFPLRDGRTAVLRAPRREDAAEMNRYLRICSGETDFLLRTPEECVESEAQEAAYLEKVLADPNTLMIVCEVDGEIAGICRISFNSRLKIRHRANVGLGLYRKFWGLGIGTRLFAEMESAARVRGAEQLELEFIEGNDRGRALYEKCGFRIVSEHPNAIHQPDGRRCCEYLMIKELT